MGKKSTAKKIRKHVESLPVIMRNCHENHVTTGADLIRNGQTEVNGEKVEVHKVYNVPMPVMIAVNHARRLKKLVKQYGNDVIPVYKQAMSQ